MFRILLPLLVLLLSFTASVAQAADPDQQNYRRAFSLLSNGKTEQAYSAASKGRDRVLNKILLSNYMAQPGNSVSFEQMAVFLRDNPDWPKRRDIVSIAEQKLPKSLDQRQVLSWFAAYPPVSLAGFYRYTDALSLSGQPDLLAATVKDRWINGSFSAEQLAAFYSHFSPLLGREAQWARLDRLLWDGDVKGARQVFPYVEPMMQKVAEARLSLAAQERRGDELAAQINSGWEKDQGLIYERLRWRVKKNINDDAIEILLNAPQTAEHGDAWWEQRHIMIRRLLEQKETAIAYRLAAEHGTLDAKSVVSAEFMAGWLALRSLNRPDVAAQHFQRLIEAASTPISRARGSYWLGRALEAGGQTNAAMQSYQDAAAYNYTFYGQLATAKLTANPQLQIKPEAEIPAAIKSEFLARDHVAAIKKLLKYNAASLSESYFRYAANNADQRAHFVLLINLAHEIARPDLAILAAKAANQKNIPISFGAYPILADKPPTPPEAAFTHAVIRQESVFDPRAKSSAGAVGLMQLLPSTAKGVAKKHGISMRAHSLSEPKLNVRLGTAYLQEQLDKFDGSMILTLAAYNAGPARARQWINQYGDPRSPNVDALDWLEVIPIYETRNYIQRIMENLQIYRALLSGGTAKLLIEQDIKR